VVLAVRAEASARKRTYGSAQLWEVDGEQTSRLFGLSASAALVEIDQVSIQVVLNVLDKGRAPN